MSQPANKKLSDIARENNVAKANQFSNSMIPKPPPVKTMPVEEKIVEPEPAASVESQPAVDESGPVAEAPAPSEPGQPAKQTRQKRSSGTMSVDELILPQPPKEEGYPKQVRISAKHHRLLREVSFKKDVTINHVLYNLLEQLYEANQRDNQPHV